MKKILFLLLLTSTVFGQTVSQKSIPGYGAGFNTNDQNASALMEMRSTTKGFLPSRMTTTQRDLISSPAPYLMIANTTTGTYQFYNGSAWVNVGGGGSTPTLQAVTTAGNETRNPIIFKDAQNSDLSFEFKSILGYPSFRNVEIGNGNWGSFFFGDNTGDNVYLFPDVSTCKLLGYDGNTGILPVNGIPFTFNPATGGQLAITADIKTPIAGTNITIDNTIPAAPIINSIADGSNINALDPIIESNEMLNSVLQHLFDNFSTKYLSKNGDNAENTVDLQAVGQGITGIFVKGATIEINTISESKTSVISGNLLTGTRAMEMPDYTGTLTTEGYVNANIKTPIAGTGITIDNTDPVYPIINAIAPVKVIFTPTTGNTINAVNNAYNIINSGTLLSLTIALPSSPVDEDVVEFKFINGITTVTYTGGTVAAPLVNPVMGELVKYVYDSANAKWF